MSLPKWFSPSIVSPAVAILSAAITVAGVFFQLRASSEQHAARLDRIEHHVERIDEKLSGFGERLVRVETWQESQRLAPRR